MLTLNNNLTWKHAPEESKTCEKSALDQFHYDRHFWGFSFFRFFLVGLFLLIFALTRLMSNPFSCVVRTRFAPMVSAIILRNRSLAVLVLINPFRRFLLRFIRRILSFVPLSDSFFLGQYFTK